jgi:chromosome segregation ATPase
VCDSQLTLIFRVPQHQAALQDAQRERDTERSKLESDKKKLEDDIVKMKTELKKATTEGVITESKQKEWKKMTEDCDKFKRELEQCKTDLDACRKLNKVKEEDMKRKDGDLSSYKETMKPITTERDELKVCVCVGVRVCVCVWLHAGDDDRRVRIQCADKVCVCGV